MRLYCKVKKEHDRIASLEEQLQQAQQALAAQSQQPPLAASSTSTNTNNFNTNNTNNTNANHSYNNTNHSHNTINNYNNYSINLPEGTWSRHLWGVMLHLIKKTKGDITQKSELEFNEAFGKTLSVAFFHPDSPLYNTVKMLGRKEAWAKLNGKVVQKKKLLKKINQQHLDRLIHFIHEDNERYEKEFPCVDFIKKWMHINIEVVEHIKKYDPCERDTMRESEEVFRSESVLEDFDTLLQDVIELDSMDRTIAASHERDQKNASGHEQ